jgi:hypothetical protein
MSNSQFAVISINPSAQHQWNRCNVREVFSGLDVNLKQLATAGLEKGNYLVRLTVSVEVLNSNSQEAEQLDREALERDFAF